MPAWTISLILCTGLAAPAAAVLPTELPRLPELHGEPDPDYDAWRALATLMERLAPCGRGPPAQVLACLDEEMRRFIPSCQHLVPCLSMLQVSILPGYRLDQKVDWYTKQAWVTLPLTPPTRDDEGTMVYVCANLESQCGGWL